MKLGGSLLDLPDLMDRLNRLSELLQPAPVLLIPGGGAAANLVRSLDQQFGLTPEKAHWTAIAAMSFNAVLLARLDSRFRVVSDRDAAKAVWSTGRIAVLDVFAFLKAEEQGLEVENRERTPVVPARRDSEPSSASRHRVHPSGSTASCATPSTGAEAVKPPGQARWRLNYSIRINDDYGTTTSGGVLNLLPASWDVTSDSIAAWVAARWPASELVVAKSCDAVSPCSIGTLIESGMLDPFFSTVIGTVKIQWLNLRNSPLNLFPLNDNDDPSQ